MLMDEQVLEAQGVAALGARRKMLKTFEVRQENGHRLSDRATAANAPVVGVYSGEFDW